MRASNNTAARRYLDHVITGIGEAVAAERVSQQIIEDYALPTCKAAVDDFRAKHSIHSLVTTIDWSGIFWRK
jgi:hypothetical protein